MFYGQYEHALDDKGRLTIPSKLRDILVQVDDGKGMLTRGLEGCIFLFGRSRWERLQRRFESLPTLSAAKVRAFVRLMASGASEFELDGHGRVFIPQALRDHARIDKEVVVIGASEHVEIWSKEGWAAYLEREAQTFEETAEGLVDFGI